MTHHSLWNVPISTLVIVSACVAASTALVGNFAAQQTDTSSIEWTRQEAQKSLQEKSERLQNMRQEVSQDANTNAQKERDILGQLEGFYNEMVQTEKQQDFNRFWDANRNFDNNTGTFWRALDDTDAATAQNGLDENWRKDILRNLDDQLRSIKDLERNASKDPALLSEIQSFKTSIDGHRSCVQSASTQEALQACNDAMKSMWDISSKLWTRNDIANRQRELTEMERQIKDAEREKADVSKAKGILEQLRTAIANVQSLASSGADNRDVQDALQDTVNPLQQEFNNSINASRRQGEAARFRNDQLKNMERQIKETERNKGDVTKLREILEIVKGALVTAEQLVQNGADSRDVDDAFRDLYDKQNEFSNLQNTTNKAGEVARWRKEQLPNLERQIKNVRKNKGDTSALEAIIAGIKTSLDRAEELTKNGADSRDIDDLFQDEIYGKEQEFWDLQNATQRGGEIDRWTKKGGELSNMEREIKRMAREKVDTSALQSILDKIKERVQALQSVSSEEQQDVLREIQDDLQPEFWNTMDVLNAQRELAQWTRKNGHLAKMQKIVDTLKKKGKDVNAAEQALEQIRYVLTSIEQSTDRDALEDGRYDLEDLRRQFNGAIRPYMKKKSKGGFPFPMKK